LTRQLVDLDWFESEAYINPDDIAQSMPGGWRNADNFRPAAEYAQVLRYRRLAEAKDIVFETVLSSPEKLEFLQEAQARGYFVHLIYVCTTDPTINAARVCRRVMEHGHDVPIEKIISRYYRSVAFAPDALPCVSVAHLFDNSNEFGAPTLVAHVQDGLLSVVHDPPDWMVYIREQSEANNLAVQERQVLDLNQSLSSTSFWFSVHR
jgi:predicted ABC-type ATPase